MNLSFFLSFSLRPHYNRGPAHPTVDSPCSCHYEGKLIDGTVFDSSYERGQPTTFAPNQVIKGWTEAMQLMVA
jgi:FKBP-type peptidyl-prolyl cis-trans isomerase FklB